MKVINLGADTYVRADLIAAIDVHNDENNYVMGNKWADKSCAVLLTTGQVIPGFFSVRTIKDNWRKAIEDGGVR